LSKLEILYIPINKACRSLSNSDDYDYFTVFHKYNFVNPAAGVHSQHVESYNMSLRFILKQEME